MAHWTEDLISRLPVESADKVRDLLETQQAALGALRLASADVEDARQRWESAEAQAQRQISGMSQTRDPETVERMLAPVARRKAELDRAVGAEARASEAWEKFAFIENLRDWVATYFGRDGKLRHESLPKIGPRKGETLRQAIDRVRTEIERVETEWRAVEQAPMPLAEVKAEIASSVDAIAAKGAPEINARAREGDPAGIGRRIRLDIVGGNKIGDGGASFFVWLMRDALVDRLCCMVDNLDMAAAMTDAERDARFTVLADRRLSLERQEEALVTAAAEDGLRIDRRDDADPRAVLEVAEEFEDEPLATLDDDPDPDPDGDDDDVADERTARRARYGAR